MPVDNTAHVQYTSPFRQAARRGALWTSPIWAAVLLFSCSSVIPGLDEFIGNDNRFFTPLMILFMAGSSLCFLSGLFLSGGGAGFTDVSKRALASALAVSFTYALSALVMYFFSGDAKSAAWGGGFALASTPGSLAAALLGGWARLLFRQLAILFNPYKPVS